MKRLEYNNGNIVNTEHGIAIVAASAFGRYQVLRNKDIQIWADKIEPVLLSSGEWFDKFKLLNTDYGYSIKYDDTHTLRLIHSNGEYYPQIEELPEMSHEETQVVSLRSIKYVHELQELLITLTGKESECVL